MPPKLLVLPPGSLSPQLSLSLSLPLPRLPQSVSPLPRTHCSTGSCSACSGFGDRPLTESETSEALRERQPVDCCFWWESQSKRTRTSHGSSGSAVSGLSHRRRAAADVSPRGKKPQRWISPPKGVIPLRPRGRAAADRVHMHKWPGREEGSGEKVGGRQKGTQSQSRCKIMLKKSLFKKLRGCRSGVLPVSRPLTLSFLMRLHWFLHNRIKL